MGKLPKPEKRGRYWTDEEEEHVAKIAEMLGCARTTAAVLNALTKKKSSFDLMRQQLGLDVTPYMAIDGITNALENLREAASLEETIQKALKCVPFKKCVLQVTLSKPEGKHNEVLATLTAQEKKDPMRMGYGPMMEYYDTQEPKTAILDQNRASTMVAAVKGLMP